MNPNVHELVLLFLRELTSDTELAVLRLDAGEAVILDRRSWMLGHRSLTGSFRFGVSSISGMTGATIGGSKSITYGTRAASATSSGDTPSPWVRICRFAFETTENVRSQPGNVQGYALGPS